MRAYAFPRSPIRSKPDRKCKTRSAIIHAGRARRVSSFFRRSNPIDPVKEIIARVSTILQWCSRKRAMSDITHRNVLCRKLTLYFVSRMLIRFIIRGISVRRIALHAARVPFRGAPVHFDSYGAPLLRYKRKILLGRGKNERSYRNGSDGLTGRVGCPTRCIIHTAVPPV